ncbi:DUF1254 domain-containing protein [Pandoraea pneumonica]|nr:DUF1254 domain-containing protein [Pandoraea pneumonica]
MIVMLFVGRSACAGTLTEQEARSIAKEAVVYGFPMVDSYRIQYAYFVDKHNPEYKGAWNEVHGSARVFTPEDRAVQTPNSDTPYSMLGADLRSEPLVLTVPAVDKKRYYSLQFIDLYTHNFAYVGSRATGNGPGRYLLVGPNWKGSKPTGINEVIRSETELALVVYRTQLINPADLENVKHVQAGYHAQPLSQFLNKQSPNAPKAIEFIKPLTPEEERTSLKFFEQLNFVLQFAPAVPSEKKLRSRFQKIGLGVKGGFDPNAQSPEIQEAMKQGMADAWEEFEAFKRNQIDTGKFSSADCFGTRAALNNNYMARMAGAVLGIYGNSKAEALYPLYFADASQRKLNGQHRYTLHFSSEQLPPVNAFWSLTVYELPQSLLYANALNRYLINSPMLPDLKRDQDGGLTIYLQNESPGPDKESNWLPVPKGPFSAVLRLYWPKEAAISGAWTAPQIQRVD